MLDALRHQQQRFEAFQGEDVIIHVNGAFFQELHAPLDTLTALSLPPAASFMEVYGRDIEGQVLLAVCPIPTYDLDETPEEQSLVLRQANGVTVELSFRPHLVGPDGLYSMSLHVLQTAEQPQPRL
ncbi:MAG: hypothetical protein FJZ47_14605 [Candidatus Tectomicrobia bacterium]|uniref:Uncharacterized protein n=1 Tax=Tectimicrobiota bacterium TaxID=2528274 RepID=A0A937W197_UNCTE|nr:hypothetical protein [Candidatus Tectomicrobia bacterium]